MQVRDARRRELVTAGSSQLETGWSQTQQTSAWSVGDVQDGGRLYLPLLFSPNKLKISSNGYMGHGDARRVPVLVVFP